MKESFDLNELLRGALAQLEGILDGHLRLTVDLAEGLPLALGDRPRLERILWRLALAAREAIAAGGDLSLRTRMDFTGGLRLEVRSGAPLKDCRRAWGDPAEALAPVRASLERMGGALDVFEAPKEQTLVFLLPVGRPGRGRVLAVGSPVSCARIAEVLASLGLEVLGASNARSACELWRDRGAFDLIVAVRPDLKGAWPELFRILRRDAACRELPLVILGADSAAFLGGDARTWPFRGMLDAVDLTATVGDLMASEEEGEQTLS